MFLLSKCKMETTEDGKSRHCFTSFINSFVHLALIKTMRQFKVLLNILVLIVVEVR